MKEPVLPDVIDFRFVKRAAIGIALMCFVEIFMPQQYGKLAGDALVQVPAKIGWWLMELPVSLTFGYLFWIRGQPNSHLLVPKILGTIFSLHYAYRGWYFPLTLRVHADSKSGFSLFTAVGGWLVTVMHGYLNAKWFGKHGKRFTSTEYLKSARFWIGFVMYYTGFLLIIQQDEIMKALRDKPGASRYQIPRGGVWEYSNSANYFVELVAWFGFWVLSDFGPNGAFIFFVSLFNLVPRSISNYNWYVEKFGEEFTSLNRSVLVPGVW